jgi:hypothetical protein
MLDRFIAGELTSAERAPLESHLSTCPRCEARLRELRRSHESFPAKLPRRVAERARLGAPSSAPNTWRRSVPAAVACLGLAAAAVVWLRVDGDATNTDARLARSKGSGARVTIYAQHLGAVRRVSDGERVSPGDAIEFAYSADRGGYLAVLSVDGAHHASAYYAPAGKAARIEPARESLLDQRTILDATLGEEVIYAIFCDGPVEVEPILRELETQGGTGDRWTGCSVDRHVLVKVRP